jgi:hypothetical protein
MPVGRHRMPRRRGLVAAVLSVGLLTGGGAAAIVIPEAAAMSGPDAGDGGAGTAPSGFPVDPLPSAGVVAVDQSSVDPASVDPSSIAPSSVPPSAAPTAEAGGGRARPRTVIRPPVRTPMPPVRSVPTAPRTPRATTPAPEPTLSGPVSNPPESPVTTPASGSQDLSAAPPLSSTSSN